MQQFLWSYVRVKVFIDSASRCHYTVVDTVRQCSMLGLTKEAAGCVGRTTTPWMDAIEYRRSNLGAVTSDC